MNDNLSLMMVVFGMVCSLVLFVGLVVAGRNRKVDARLNELSGKGKSHIVPADANVFTKVARQTLPSVGKHLIPDDAQEKTQLRTRLIHAGMYSSQAMAIFLGVKVLLMIAPALLGLLIGVAGLLPTNVAVLIGACFSIVGMIGPSFWLDKRKTKCQTILRRSLPDALDLFVICLEGGLGMAGALRRVVSELQLAHPVLAQELNIVQREMQLGKSTGDALRGFSNRTDLEEIRSLAAVVFQAERFGAGMVKTMRTYAETLRQKRQQRAEEMAQKAGTKILFPTLLFIFPAIFIVILGPAVIQILQMMKGMNG